MNPYGSSQYVSILLLRTTQTITLATSHTVEPVSQSAALVTMSHMVADTINPMVATSNPTNTLIHTINPTPQAQATITTDKEDTDTTIKTRAVQA
jgi:hypothetical protein